MPGWSRICCAVDFSNASTLAMQQAAELAKQFQADLTLVHVYQPPEILATVPEVMENASMEMARKLESWRYEAERVAGRPVRAAVLSGAPAVEIVRFASDNMFQLVVLATHGHTGIKHLVLGSVAERVVREADCPVLVVRKTAPFGED